MDEERGFYEPETKEVTHKRHDSAKRWLIVPVVVVVLSVLPWLPWERLRKNTLKQSLGGAGSLVPLQSTQAASQASPTNLPDQKQVEQTVNPQTANHPLPIMRLVKDESGDYELVAEESVLAQQRVIQPKDAINVYLDRAEYYESQGQSQAADMAYRQAASIDSRSDPKAYAMRGLAKKKLGLYREAVADYSEAIRLDPENFEAFNNRASVRLESHDYAGALADASKAIELNPGSAAPYVNRACALDYLGMPEKALKDYDKAIEFNPQNYAIYMERGTTLHVAGKTKEAMADYKKVLDLAPAYWPNRKKAEALIKAIEENRTVRKRPDGYLDLGQ